LGECLTTHNYWLDLFTGTTWKEFLASGGNVSGFKKSKWKTAQKIKRGDYLICYLTGISRFVGVLEVTSEAYMDDENIIWKFNTFPVRFKVKKVVDLDPEDAVPVSYIKEGLEMFKNLKNPNSWGILFRGSPKQIDDADGELILKSILDAKRNPIHRPYDKKKFERIPPSLKTKNIETPVTIPNNEENESSVQIANENNKESDHSEIQWLLLKLGSDMGFDVWVARNDKGKSFKGNNFSDIPGFLDKLPLQFDNVTTKTIELIDVLWLEKKSIISAFEIESTTSIYSGLLRMSDLIAMQPNLNIPLYLVAPDERRNKVIKEVNRPTFSRLSPPLMQICKYIPFSNLKECIKKYKKIMKFIKPELLNEISESCDNSEFSN
jgi:hypothetical protein